MDVFWMNPSGSLRTSPQALPGSPGGGWGGGCVPPLPHRPARCTPRALGPFGSLPCSCRIHSPCLCSRPEAEGKGGTRCFCPFDGRDKGFPQKPPADIRSVSCQDRCGHPPCEGGRTWPLPCLRGLAPQCCRPPRTVGSWSQRWRAAPPKDGVRDPGGSGRQRSPERPASCGEAGRGPGGGRSGDHLGGLAKF